MTRIRFVIGMLAAAAFVSVSAWRVVWFRDFGISVTCEGKPIRDARVYRHEGDIFVDFGSATSVPYVIRPRNNTVGIPGSGFIAMTRFFALAKEEPVLIVDMRSAKNESRDSKLALTAQSAIFIDIDGRAIRLVW